MTIHRSLIPQIVLNLGVMIGCLIYAPRAFRTRKNRFVAVFFFLVGLAALIANLKGYAVKGWIEGGGLDRI